MQVYLHTVWIQLSDRSDTAVGLDLDQTTLQCLQLVIDGKKSFGNGLRGKHKGVDVSIAASDEV